MLAGLSRFSPTLRSLIAAGPAGTPDLGGFLFLTVAALAAGMAVSAIRWALVDTLHARLGLRPPALDFGALGPNVAAFARLIEIHYRHYQFYANMLVATAVAYACHRAAGAAAPLGWLDVGVMGLEAVFFATSRDTLRKYYARTAQLLPAAPGPRGRRRGRGRP